MWWYKSHKANYSYNNSLNEVGVYLPSGSTGQMLL
jgi:hypothetical protein